MYACTCEIVIVCVCVDVCVLEMCEVVSPCEATDYDRIAPRKGRSSLQQLTPLTKGRRFRSAFTFPTQEDHMYPEFWTEGRKHGDKNDTPPFPQLIAVPYNSFWKMQRPQTTVIGLTTITSANNICVALILASQNT